MSNYISFDYYINTYNGNLIPQQEFNKYATKASNKVRNRILNNNNIDMFEIQVKNATCSVADILYNQFLNKERLKNISNGSEVIISIEKVGDYSRNISNISISDLEKLCSDEYINNLIENELEDYLFFTGLLYSGVISV